MYSKIAAMLDDVADSLEKKGLIKEAYEIDKIADMIEANIPYGTMTELGKDLTEVGTQIKAMGVRADVEPAKIMVLKVLDDRLGHGLSEEKHAEYTEATKKCSNMKELYKLVYNIILAAPMSMKRVYEE